MTRQMRPVTPRGFRDVLFDEAAQRRTVAGAIGEVFASYGFRYVETPAVEQYATLEAALGSSLEGTVFRLVDLDGSLLALRPEMTLPIARVAAARLTREPGPFRICYDADVYRERASLRGEARQFRQLGIELLGANGPSPDAEVICALVDALAAAGLESFTVGVGTVAVLCALIDAAGAGPDWASRVLAAAHARNLVEIDRLSRDGGVERAAGEALRSVVRIGGGREAIDACRAATAPVGCDSALDSLEAVWTILEAAGAAPRVRVDFGILRSFDYYTGLILEAYAPGLGVSLGGGGRYDDVMGTFGDPMPAAGFALSLDRVLIALAAQGFDLPVRGLDAVVGGEAVSCARECARLRATGWHVQSAPGIASRSALREAARRAGARWVVVPGDGVAEVLDGRPGFSLEPAPGAPTLAGARPAVAPSSDAPASPSEGGSRV